MSEALLEFGIVYDEGSSIGLEAPAGSLPLIPRIIPAIARQATLKFVDTASTATTSMVVAAALETLGFPAGITTVEVSVDRQSSSDSASVHRDRYSCVLTGAILIDACLDRMSAPGNRASLRPSWFELPADWDSVGRASYSNVQTGTVVSYRRTIEARPDSTGYESAELIDRIAAEVVDLCRQSEQILAGLEPDSRRWIPVQP